MKKGVYCIATILLAFFMSLSASAQEQKKVTVSKPLIDNSTGMEEPEKAVIRYIEKEMNYSGPAKNYYYKVVVEVSGKVTAELVNGEEDENTEKIRKLITEFPEWRPSGTAMNPQNRKIFLPIHLK